MMSITRKGKRETTFVEEHQGWMNTPFGIGHEKVTDARVLETLPKYLDPDYTPPIDAYAFRGELADLYHIFGYFFRNLEYIPLDAQLRLDQAMIEISFVMGAATETCVDVGGNQDFTLDRTNKGHKTTRKRRDTEDKPIILECLQKFLKDHKDILDTFFMKGACKIIAKNSGYSLSKVLEIVKEHYEETGQEPPFKKRKSKKD